MKIKFMLLTICMSAVLSGCTLITPNGTVKLDYDTSQTSEDTKLQIGDQEFIIDTASVRESIDTMLDSVSLPEGTSSEELKEFVYNKFELGGIDLDADNVDSEKVSEVVESALNEFGVVLEEDTDSEGSLSGMLTDLIKAAKESVSSVNVSGTMDSAKEALEDFDMDSGIADMDIYNTVVGE